MYIKRLKDLREDHDYKQKDVAEYLKITQQQYSLYEKGNRTLPVDLLIKLTDLYNVSADYILDIEDKTKKKSKKNVAKIKNNGTINNSGTININ